MSDDSALIDVAPMATTAPLVPSHNDDVEMARAQTYRAAKCAMEIHRMLKMVPELEGWMQAKITLAADYLEAVASNLEYDLIAATMDADQTSIMPGSIMEAAQVKKVDPKMLHAMRALSKQFNKAFTKADIADKKKGEQIDAVANLVADITDRIAHSKTPFADPAASRLGKMERAVFDHFEGVLQKVLNKETDKNEVKKAVVSSVKKFGPKLVDARKADTKGLPKDVPDDKSDSKKKS